MILSASRRTDIPAFYGEWLCAALRLGEVFVQNPMNSRQVSRIELSPELIDCIVFWTKNPAPFMRYLPDIDNMGYKYYFQFTLTPYDRDIERNIDKGPLLDIFAELSQRIGKEKVIWRYDPILINQKYSAAFHRERFEELAEKLHSYTEKCVISFVDSYSSLKKDFGAYGIGEPAVDDIETIASAFSRVAKRFDSPLLLASCCEKTDLAKHGIAHNKCVDDALIARITGRPIKAKKDSAQRKNCACIASRDIGTYNSCRHDCLYCYARRGAVTKLFKG